MICVTANVELLSLTDLTFSCDFLLPRSKRWYKSDFY